ncbi:winged helix-turn-helix domain-containing protein [Pseudoalteromonas haloplanktis]|uniref:Winged helix-turn-helix domain-containing protein n=1 Tax=Pseudoalteromonas haloplanktis TaxID=228 RepID=A0ABU1B9P8_PSEHA|nr:winged helix-turn-helix domain-containing protein [Pseudoalteromonas haloplanktis]MDQ9091076.1 winged helix-turn-helix domain-containing protein [Pseudoalteromonas haloplanktis]
MHGRTQLLEPKVMTMLIVLCEHANSIISAEELFKQVWPHSIYSPNSVRRNIALLRKALCDDDKKLIKTHPKRGYSLQAIISSLSSPADAKIYTKPKVNNHKIARYVTVLCTFIFLVITWVIWQNTPASQQTVNNLKPITASKAIEHYMRVSPNHDHMAIIRSESHQGTDKHIYIKDLKRKKTWKITKEAQNYTYLAWRNANSLVYSASHDSGIEFGQILLDDGLQSTQQTQLIRRSDISWNSPFFIDKKQQLFYLANINASEHSRNVTLYQHNLISGEVRKLLTPNDTFKPYKISLSPQQNKLAVIGFNADSISVVKTFDIKTTQFEMIKALDHNWYFLTWQQDQQSLLLSNGKDLSLLHVSGDWQPISYNNYHFLQYIQAVAGKLYFLERRTDEDLYLANRTDVSNIKTISDSNNVDTSAAVSPNEQMVTYISSKNGIPQLFLKELDSNNESIIFDNHAQELALAPPVWLNNTHLISALNNRPFVISLLGNNVNIKWVDNLLGIPLIVLENDDTFIYVDKSAQGDWLYTYNLSTTQKQPLHEQLNARQLFKNEQQQLISASNNTIENISTKTKLITVPGAKLRVFPSKNGIYYRSFKSNKYQLGFYGYKSEDVKPQHELATLCEQVCDQLQAVSDSYYVLSKKVSQADILSLEISHEE